jgi:hypothetical protein
LDENIKAVWLSAFFFDNDFNESPFLHLFSEFLKIGDASSEERAEAKKCYNDYIMECKKESIAEIAGYDKKWLI